MKWRVVATAPAVVAAALTCRLLAAFVRSDFSYRLVAEQSRAGSAWYYRLAGAWASAEGSLLVLTGIVAVIGMAGTWRTPRPMYVVAATTAALLAIVSVAAWPFNRSAVPATRGIGLTPILEHPAMAVHPPLLYAGFAAALVPYARAVADPIGDRAADRTWLRRAIGALTAAMALGAFWSYAEQGWGGYWAWDPVENSSFAVWLALLAATHVMATRPGRRVALLAATGPWCVVLLGSAASRSGTVPSVHAFADATAVGASLLAVGGITAAVVAVCVARAPAAGAGGAPPLVRTQLALVLGVLVIVAGGVLVPFLARLVDVDAIVTGRFYAPVVLPFALAALVVLAVLARRRSPRAPKVPGWAWIAHGAVVLAVAGVLWSTLDRTTTVGLGPGASVDVLGVRLEHEGVQVLAGPRPGSQVVRANLRADGEPIAPSLVTYPERGGVLAETALRTGLTRDVRIGLLRADDRQMVLVEVRTRPAMLLVWLGAAGIAGASLAGGQGSGRGSSSARRARLRSNNAVTVSAWAGAGPDGTSTR